MDILTRYWFKFEQLPKSSILNLGCGVTAYDYEDALLLLKERVFGGNEIPKIAQCQENIDVSALDPRHIRPNMGPIFPRGIWFPQGYY
jgi:hypothetical protein